MQCIRFNLATKLQEKMAERAPRLFDNSIMVCCVYLDPRIMKKLAPTQNSFAQSSLIKIFDRLKEMKQTECRVVNDTLDEIQSEFINQDFPAVSRVPLLQEMEKYERVPAYDIRANVMKFWQENKNTYPLLHQLAEILHAIPSNQCGTERSFSSFSYLRSRYRMSMSAENLSNILMVRLNKEIFYELKKKRIQQIIGTTE